LGDAALDRLVAHAVEAPEVVEDLAAREAVVEAHAAVHHADGGAHGLGVAGDVVARDGRGAAVGFQQGGEDAQGGGLASSVGAEEDRKSTRLNSSHVKISYAVFCLKKKNSEACASYVRPAVG